MEDGRGWFKAQVLSLRVYAARPVVPVSTIGTVAPGVNTPVHRQDHARYPGSAGEVEHCVGDVFGGAVTAERLHVVEAVEFRVA
jgi:hypothetical protein